MKYYKYYKKFYYTNKCLNKQLKKLVLVLVNSMFTINFYMINNLFDLKLKFQYNFYIQHSIQVIKHLVIAFTDLNNKINVIYPDFAKKFSL